MTDVVTYQVSNGVAWLTINRPDGTGLAAQHSADARRLERERFEKKKKLLQFLLVFTVPFVLFWLTLNPRSPVKDWEIMRRLREKLDLTEPSDPDKFDPSKFKLPTPVKPELDPKQFKLDFEKYNKAGTGKEKTR